MLPGLHYRGSRLRRPAIAALNGLWAGVPGGRAERRGGASMDVSGLTIEQLIDKLLTLPPPPKREIGWSGPVAPAWWLVSRIATIGGEAAFDSLIRIVEDQSYGEHIRGPAIDGLAIIQDARAVP